MTADAVFEVVKIVDNQIHIRHSEQKHFYTFVVSEGADGEPQLSAEPVYFIEVVDAKNTAAELLDAARQFAKHETAAAEMRSRHGNDPPKSSELPDAKPDAKEAAE